MKLNRKLLAGSAAAVIATVGISGAAIAATSTNASNPEDSLVQKIADKFHLNKTEVQAVFDENHKEKQQKHQQMLKERLDQAVKDGKLTQDQADKLLAKLKELHDQKKEDRKAAHDDLQKWAKDNGIDLSQVMPKHDGPRHHRHRQ